MKDILKQIGATLVTIGCSIIQLVAFMLIGIGWMFGKAGELLTDVTCKVAGVSDPDEKENTSEEAPTEA